MDGYRLGSVQDPESVAGDGTVIALLKRLRTLLANGLPGLGTAASVASSAGIAASTNTLAGATNRRLLAVSYRESAATAAAAAFNLRHGAADADPLVLVVELAANQSGAFSFGDRGVAAPNGVRTQVLAGTIDVVLHYADVA